jgi:vancomycin resistance protein VanJ
LIQGQEIARYSRSKPLAALTILFWSYIGILWLFLALRFAFQDKWWWLGFLNFFTPYWFTPLLIIGPFAAFIRKWVLQIAVLLSVCLFLFLFGQLLIPKWSGESPKEGTLTVMSYNVFGENNDWKAIRRSIVESEADVIALQELSRPVAALIRAELTELYPYQIIDSQDSLISRYPITLTEVTLPDSWGSPPQIYLVNVDGQLVTVLNAHFYASFLSFDYFFMQWVFREREHQAQLVADFAAGVETPLIVTADFNTTDQSQAYRILTRQLNDSWREAGWGMGHTFPGGQIPELPRPLFLGYPVPRWIVRIDYIFYSDDWRAQEARLGRWDGTSDHRPIIAVLELKARP